MYNDFSSRFATMGDVDVIWHDGEYHLFHLILPNHDFIAHAVSPDGLNWERVENALFIGHPGAWDDLMLWTMHVSSDPHQAGQWRMFYTGLCRADRGTIQRIGLAKSSDLVHWTKVLDQQSDVAADGLVQHPPLVARQPDYEERPRGDRTWVSFRDPFFFREGERGYLLMAARADEGPSIRRGCVGIAEEVAPDQFRLKAPLHRPGQYDDVEVPNLVRLDDRYYLVGSIREDAKVRYWCSDAPAGPWRNYYDNVLLPEGNYAARLSWDAEGPLIWNFYTPDVKVRTRKNLMPPPKRLATLDDGRLTVRSFEGFDALHKETHSGRQLTPLQPLLENEHCWWKYESDQDSFRLCSDGGFEGFLFPSPVECFRFEATLRLTGLGKCGLLVRVDPSTSDGYHLSLDLLKGVAQWRSWGHRTQWDEEEAFRFESLQSNYWRVAETPEFRISLLAVGSYFELSIEDHVLLSLADETFERGHLGMYVESACIDVEHPRLEHLYSPSRPSDELANR